jgi:ABC-type Fe3+ transport system permease subunit
VDQRCQRLGRVYRCAKQNRLPPRPGEKRGRNGYLSKDSAQLAVQIQGRCDMARVMAASDVGIVWLIFTVTVLLVTVLVRVFVTDDNQPEVSSEEEWQYVPLAYLIWGYIYTSDFTSGSYHRYGEPWTFSELGWISTGALQAFWRSAMIYVSLISIVGVLMGWIRRDGRRCTTCYPVPG